MEETLQNCGCWEQDNHPERAFHWVGFLHCQGLTLRVVEGKLHVSPKEAITPHARDLIQRRKTELIGVFKHLKDNNITN